MYSTHFTNAKKQIVISCDSPPKEINGIEERLVSRFGCGLVADIQPPDLETRMAILQQKAEDKKYNIPEDVIIFIAQNIPSNIRELEGALNKTVACSEFNNEPMSIENVSLWLKDLLRDSNSGPINIGLIQKLVSETFAIPIEDLLSQNRSAELALARQKQCILLEIKHRRVYNNRICFLIKKIHHSYSCL